MTEQQFQTTTQFLAEYEAKSAINRLITSIRQIILNAKPTFRQLIEAYILTVEYIKALKAVFGEPKDSAPVKGKAEPPAAAPK